MTVQAKSLEGEGDTVQEISAKDVDALLVSELNALSMDERSRVYEEVHGVCKEVDEKPEFIRQRLEAMEHAIHHVNNVLLPPDGMEAYMIAYNKSPSYVMDTKFRLMFLRAERFDPVLAAKRFVSFHGGIRHYFGDGVLGRPLTLTDLDKDDMKVLKSGFVQRLAQRDTSGRGVLCDFAFLVPTEFESYRTVNSMIRAVIYYTTTFIIQDEQSQKLGLVAVIYAAAADTSGNAGSSLFRQDKLQEEVSEKLSRIIRCLPFRYTGFHLCASDWIVKACAPFIKMIIGKKYRVRLRVHVGSNTECEYALLSFGIPVSTLPLSYDCKVKATAHNKWIARQSVREQHIRLSNVIFAGIDLPTNNDCLLGRGRDRYRHRGNHLLRYHVESFLSKYESAAYGDKLSIASVIVRIVKENGGRFLQAEKHGWWVEVDDAAAQDKVTHAFRTLCIAETTDATAGANADKKTERSNKKA
eukprot:CAMPEP_0113446548 /NCGR_PEP_ID=MMETSP0014_2-20120614/3767_1 /TAXON_ID=2857 /ORGANISM="Nitzschia sp." /LENGTH=468 /DNA_ID=CAMNT_0000337651 /DNA_START=79 /DNA_END=1482 /DNA_ORIENTATION=+ /assembly_acc=CAM_ASM_000159